jgi:hypothetical protein
MSGHVPQERDTFRFRERVSQKGDTHVASAPLGRDVRLQVAHEVIEHEPR